MDKEPTQAFIEKRLIHLNRGQSEIPLFQGELLNPGNGSAGPAVIVRNDTTIFLDEGDDWEVDQHNNLIISIN
jgi:N-methylhydantoinase A/oxoprolinase/acetone carboxylase beta subunit